MRLFTQSIDKAISGSIATEVSSIAHSNITILGPRDSVSRRSWTHEVTSFDFGDFWKYRAEFFFNTLLYCLNIGNLWRLPTQAIQYGEGAFIYMYIVFTLVFGMPLLFFEFSVGQYTDRGVMHVFRIIPVLEGLSSAMGFFSNTVVHVYGLISVFNFIYFFSFIRIDAPLSNTTDFKKMCFYENRTNSLENLHFLNDVVMAEDETSCTFNSRNMFLVFVMWLVIWVYTINEYAIKPNHSVKIYTIIISALVVTFLATMTVEGSGSGILRLLSPPWKNFADYKVYLHAFIQSVISLGLGIGPLINIGSRTFFRTPIHIHSIIVAMSTLLASLLMTMIVFGAVGVYSEELGYSEAVLSGQEYYMHVLLSKLFAKMAQGLKQIIIVVFYAAFLTAGFYSSLVIVASSYEIGASFFGWYEAFCLCTYLLVVLLPISVPAIKTIIRLTKEKNLSKLFHPREIQTAFQDYANWRENLSNNS
ncbi:hypothetical protein WA026_000717 [Henosepilachna vigintioctopunctata]|uniref:Uncharacterized protein n=1 Tax=Henosepilachna vigintioctopunctata TaxID=420089 RepID=A0AAW1V6Z4_9CUCU